MFCEIAHNMKEEVVWGYCHWTHSWEEPNLHLKKQDNRIENYFKLCNCNETTKSKAVNMLFYLITLYKYMLKEFTSCFLLFVMHHRHSLCGPFNVFFTAFSIDCAWIWRHEIYIYIIAFVCSVLWSKLQNKEFASISNIKNCPNSPYFQSKLQRTSWSYSAMINSV